MKIISGKYKGLKLPKAYANTRPTTNKVTQAIFSKLVNLVDLEDFVFYDLFAGTGAMAFEALSRGCVKVYLNDKNKLTAYKLKLFIKKNNIDNARVTNLNAKGISMNFKTNENIIVFLDPPYNFAEKYLAKVFSAISKANFIIYETSKKQTRRLNNILDANNLYILSDSFYGDTAVYFITK
ncbi:MAG: RsmD family RNA methyltransferase [Bifidobacteriaceae bacterium]|jgi:16S rRNA (guanine966-N2)-methyltransferase|nr:RsmD family RNA methyltransferase [Bifidobacteriaceae bacterium]